MASMAVDTLSIARELKAAELSAIQAEAIAAAIGRSAGDSMENAATKSDLKSEATLLRAEIDAMGSRLEAKIEGVQSRLIMWFVGTQVAIGALVVALLKL